MIYVLNLFIVSGCSIIPEFSRKTHSYLGNNLDVYLTRHEPVLYSQIYEVLNGQTISSVSSWADYVKRKKEYLWTKTLHYIDVLECKNETYDTAIIDSYCKETCIISAIKSFVKELKDRQNSNTCSNYFVTLVNKEVLLSDEDLLKFIIHFMEDFIEPMHLLGYERGGNSLKLNIKMPNGKVKRTNLHQLWDSLIPEYYIKMFNPLFSFKVNRPDNYNNFVEEQFNKNIKISCSIYPKNPNEIIIFKEYFNKEYLDILFKNYHELSIGTLKYIFE